MTRPPHVSRLWWHGSYALILGIMGIAVGVSVALIETAIHSGLVGVP